jgi:hypothetical protein
MYTRPNPLIRNTFHELFSKSWIIFSLKPSFSPCCIIVLVNNVEIQQEDPSEIYAPTLGWSLRIFLGGSLFLDDEQILFIDDVYLYMVSKFYL